MIVVVFLASATVVVTLNHHRNTGEQVAEAASGVNRQVDDTQEPPVARHFHPTPAQRTTMTGNPFAGTYGINHVNESLPNGGESVSDDGGEDEGNDDKREMWGGWGGRPLAAVAVIIIAGMGALLGYCEEYGKAACGR